MDFLRITEDEELCKRSLEMGGLNLEELRVARFSRLIADFVIDEKGDCDLKKCEEVIKNFQIRSYGAFDKEFPRHVKNVLTILFQKKYQIKLKQLSPPLSSPYVERLVKLALGNKEKIEKRDVARVFLEALLIFLRQIVGSCFATSSIIYVQTNEVEMLFDDLFDLITKGFLKRVIDGVEIKIPISKKTSLNEQIESPLLRTYEYTAASFADWKTEFYKWNVYSGLGLDTKDYFGIGECVFSFVEEKVYKINEELKKLAEEAAFYEQQIRLNEALFKTASSYDQAKRLERQATIDSGSYNNLVNLYNDKKKAGEKIASFYKDFAEEITKIFPQYFQEVFDPEMHASSGEILADTPAGFRLLFKHGRSDVDAWSLIYSEKDYTKALEEFFKLIEVDLSYKFDFEGSKEFIQEVIDKIMIRISEKEFVRYAKIRTDEIRKKTNTTNPLNTPWCYVSGGNLESFASCYFGLKNKMKKVVFYPETPFELLVSLIEYMKDLPYDESSPFEENPLKSILMTNEVHAFLFRPGLEKFCKAWLHSGNTYTYLRDVDGVMPFADTNWASDLFAFAKSSSDSDYQLCRLNTFSLVPMPASWKSHFHKSKAWTLWFISTKIEEVQKFV